jgi:hypothetical protein
MEGPLPHLWYVPEYPLFDLLGHPFIHISPVLIVPLLG